MFVGADTAADGGVEGGVHAFDRSTGKERWKYPTGRGVLAEMIAQGQGLFALTGKSGFVRLDQDSGKPTWSYPLQWSLWESAAAKDNRIFLGSNDGTLYSLNALSGSVVWQTNLGARICTSIRVFESNVYAGTADGKMHRVDTGSGELRSSLRPDQKLRPAGLPVISGNNFLVLLVDAGNDYRALVSLDLGLTEALWQRVAPEKWTTSRIYAPENTVILGSKAGEVISYSCVDGERMWSLPLVGTIRSIGGAAGVLYVGTTEGTLYALRMPRTP